MKNKTATIANRLVWLLPLFLLACSSQSITPYQLAAASGDSGFGGTGIFLYRADDDEDSSGFGGTGIVGNIDAFGSIWVNGIEVDYDDHVSIISNLPGSDPELKLGQTVILETAPELNAEKRPYTEEIRIHYAMAGEIQAVETNRIRLHDQWVLLPETVQQDRGLVLERKRYVAINANQVDDTGQWTASRLNANPARVVIEPTTVEVEFSDQVRQIVIGDRFRFIRPDLQRPGSHSGKLEQQFIPAEHWHPAPADKPGAHTSKPERPDAPELIQEIRHHRNGLRHFRPPRGHR